ncbi:hypothetical protein GCM10012284_63230 [Mangrovihabitans endophyticus]|uniref:Uncharacterized protein n=2 Tax=Mangrovihabitans endophyticus TaxID=1751298 RepID=A0A8J3FSX7_9ACTN|nr:hypothetical protein GCM10012284_63230 [Mangrovihabitans endophyticus]
MAAMPYAWLTAPADDVADTARRLLGWRLTANGVTVRISEVKTYFQDPPGCREAHGGGRC